MLSQITTNQSEYSSRVHSVIESCSLEIVTASARKKPRKRKREIENGTGISPEDSELDLVIEEVIEKWEAADQEFQLYNQSKVKKLEKDKETAEEMRRMSMETLGASV